MTAAAAGCPVDTRHALVLWPLDRPAGEGRARRLEGVSALGLGYPLSPRIRRTYGEVHTSPTPRPTAVHMYRLFALQMESLPRRADGTQTPRWLLSLQLARVLAFSQPSCLEPSRQRGAHWSAGSTYIRKGCCCFLFVACSSRADSAQHHYTALRQHQRSAPISITWSTDVYTLRSATGGVRHAMA